MRPSEWTGVFCCGAVDREGIHVYNSFKEKMKEAIG